MCGLVAVGLIDFESLDESEKNKLKEQLRLRKRALKAQLDEVSKALVVVEGKSRRPKKKK
jgi:hypothetical protein